MKKHTKLIFLPLVALVLSSCTATINMILDYFFPTTTVSSTTNTSSTNTSTSQSHGEYGPEAYNGYYASITDDLMGTNLLNALRTLNSQKMVRRVGYSAMGTSAYGQFKYTDYDPNFVKYDTNNVPYGTKLLGYYSGKSSAGSGGDAAMNREHVWPVYYLVGDRNENDIEDDIHMVRPTLSADNGSRGNAFYAASGAFDPGEQVVQYRGDAARIIFYCCVADTQLSLVDATSASKSSGKMGKLSDLLKWSLEYSVSDKEDRRNYGAQYLQGNRNPFIDHPSYACRVWGNTNATTKSICGYK